jgi:hypothetical protein
MNVKNGYFFRTAIEKRINRFGFGAVLSRILRFLRRFTSKTTAAR